MNHRWVFCGRVIDKSKMLSSHLNSKVHEPKMEEIEREKERFKKVIRNTDKLRQLEERWENIIVSYRN